MNCDLIYAHENEHKKGKVESAIFILQEWILKLNEPFLRVIAPLQFVKVSELDSHVDSN